MSTFSLPGDPVADLGILPPQGGPTGDDGARAMWARAAWSQLAEPGDSTAGALVTALGAWDALEVVTGVAALPRVADDRELRAGLNRWRPRWSRRAVDAALQAGQRAGLTLLTPESELWPEALTDLGPHAPLCLWVRGRAEVVAQRTATVALVGARASTTYGEHVANELAGTLAARGVVVVSGAAYGIDGTAHRAALTVAGATIAFLAGGADRPYPAGHTDLIEQIATSRGAVVSEVAPGAAPTRWRFLARNRLIAAMAQATIVVEAGWRSGSLNTAGHAATLGRALGAVPGPVTSSASAGCHRLLREYGAVCVTGPDDAIELLGLNTPAQLPSDVLRMPEETRVLDALTTRVERRTEDVARRCGLSVDDASAVLGMLELEGVAVRGDSGWRRARTADTRA